MPAQASSADRRKQPQHTLQAVKSALHEIDWPIAEISSHKFISPKGDRVNESFGYDLKIPREMDYLRALWVGYLCHTKAPPGLYAGLSTPYAEHSITALRSGYRESVIEPYLLLRPILPQAEIEKLEDKYGRKELKEAMKKILKKVYPFSLK